MKVTIVKWGNSQGIRLSAQILEQLGTAVGGTFAVSIEDNALVLRPQGRKQFSLSELVAGITKNNRHDELQSGPVVGKEVW